LEKMLVFVVPGGIMLRVEGMCVAVVWSEADRDECGDGG